MNNSQRFQGQRKTAKLTIYAGRRWQASGIPRFPAFAVSGLIQALLRSASTSTGLDLIG
jgi:hypothetical protein